MSLLIAFGAVAGAMLVVTLLSGFLQPQEVSNLTGLYLTVMFIGGFVFTSNIYAELHHPQRSYQYLTLPVSNTERLAGAWAISAVLFPLVSVLAMALIVLIANLVLNIIMNVSPFYSVFTGGTWTAVKIYVVTQSMFLAGAAYFSKNNFLKTVLTLFVASMILQFVFAIAAWLILSPLDPGPGFSMQMQHMTPQLEQLILTYIPNTAKVVFWYLWAPFFLVITWFSLKERQV
ncbi:MAG: hypothetical protein EA394_07385 [Bacteroidia bacterium]|nr:MAG: hypothetical protein EA394_07385 [Bacteroidia bacterium]